MSWLRKVLARAAPNTQPAQASVASPPSVDAAAALRQGDAHVEAGRFEQALSSYRLALAKDASSVAARVNLAFVLLTIDRAADARPLLVEAISLAPDNADAHFMLGSEHLRQKQAASAREHLARAVQLKPSLVWAYPPLCQAAFELGDTAQALNAAVEGLRIAPDHAQLHHYLGNVHLAGGAFALAVSSYAEALRLQPRYAAVRTHLGKALAALGRLDEAQTSLRQALADGPEDIHSWCLLGSVFRDLGMLDEALAAYRQAAVLDPRNASAFESLGELEQRKGRHEASVKAFERVVELDSDSAHAQFNLGSAYLAVNRPDDARLCLERALAIDANFAPACALGAMLDFGRGDIDRALAAFEKAIALDGQNLDFRSHHLFALSYVGDLPRYLAAAREFGLLAEQRATPFRQWQVAVGGHDRPQPLRLGLVSGDLRSHPVGYFIESVASHFASHGIELYAFPTSHQTDELTARLKQRLAGWQPINGMTDAAAAHLIRERGIHVLIDLAGHTAHNRLALFAWRPAPVQAAWLGYWASTGVRQIDYVVADDIAVSDDSPEQFTERAWRLPQTRLCFTEPGPHELFPVSRLPMASRGYPTLGSFQDFNKINARVLSTWGEIFRKVPNARLVLRSRQSGNAEISAAMQRRLSAAGIDRARVDILPPAQRADYLRSYTDVDFVLDTFPFPGGTTTCEALWMGVPTLTLRGASMLERQGAGLMTCAGLPEWVATDIADYVRRAMNFAAAPEELAELRQSLRERVVASPIFDGAAFASHFAGAMLAIWAASGDSNPVSSADGA